MKRITALILCFVLLLSGCVITQPHTPAADSTGLTVHYIDVGQADCALLQCDGKNMLIDGGNVEDSQLVVSYLRDQDVKTLDYVVGTHAHEDHIGGLAGVLARYPAAAVWCPVQTYDTDCFADFAFYAAKQGRELVLPEAGSVWSLGSARITVLGPVRDYEDTNDTSIVLRVDYGETSFLFTGDAETQAENDILDAGYNVSATVLKVGHHGSETSTGYRWLRSVMPRCGVISCGTGNDYGHPHDGPLSKLRDADVQLYRTDLQGHIVCSSDGTTVTFRTQKPSAVTNPTEMDGSGQNAQAEQFIGNANSKKFHLPTCSSLPSEKNRVFFETYDEAVKQGYTPCGSCLK